MAKFPVDAPKSKVIKALGLLGFRLVREREHIALARDNPDGTQTPLTKNTVTDYGSKPPAGSCIGR